MNGFFKKHSTHSINAAMVLAAVVLYLFGLKFLLLPVLVFLNLRYVPLPKVFDSWLSRIVVSSLLTAVLLQIAATAQFLVLPQSNFMTLAVVLVLLQVGLWAFAPTPEAERYKDRRLLNSKDVCAFIVAAFFLLPFTPIFVGKDSVYKISQIGSLEAIDATNHYAGIAELNVAQHLTYAPSYYYPKGFHIATAFTENTVMPSQFSLGWRTNAVLFFMQYVVLAVALAYALFYLCVALLGATGHEVKKRSTKLLLAFCLGPSLALLYLVPLVNEGFLNYYYVILTAVVGLCYLIELKDKQDKWEDFVRDTHTRWALFAYLLLVFGASVSWPLLMPPLVVVGVLYVLSPNLRVGSALKLLLSRAGWPLLIVFLLQLVPIYFQLKYSGADSTQGINLTGGLKAFHPYVLLAGAGLLLAVGLSKKLDEGFRKLVFVTYMPLFAFVVLLALMQYFTVGEIRYYVIKSSMLLEILLLVLGVALLVRAYSERGLQAGRYMMLLPVFPLAFMVLLISSNPNPLKSVRDIFRNYSHQEKPAFFDQDTSLYAKLASRGDIQHFNSTLLHYDQTKGIFYAHMQIPFWMNMMQYDGTPTDTKALDCVGKLYSNLNFGTFTPPEQQAMIEKLQECAARAHDRGMTFYIITDSTSAPMVQQTFGGVARIVHE